MSELKKQRLQQLNGFRKFLLNRQTMPLKFTDYVENCLSINLKAAKYTFHKVMVHGWEVDSETLFNTISQYYSLQFVPVDYVKNVEHCTFYTNDLNLVLKTIKYDFMFPYQRNMYSIDIIFNNKTAEEMFEAHVSLDDIVSAIVNNRFSHDMELDLSNFCNDKDFVEYKISFYTLSLLNLMNTSLVHLGRTTKVLNLSNNKLSDIPTQILSNFVKGNLIGINLSDNNIKSIDELTRMNSIIEKVWLEGNPICEDMDATHYVKIVTTKFPRLKELDGIKINQHGIIFPFWRNYLSDNDRSTKMLAEKFLMLYFSHYDSSRGKIMMFYHGEARIRITMSFSEMEAALVPHYGFLQQSGGTRSTRVVTAATLTCLPPTCHDPATFTVDLVRHDKKHLTLIVDGVYREDNYKDLSKPPNHFQFRRTFLLEQSPLQQDLNVIYLIKYEMFSLSFASKIMEENSFKNPVRNLNSLCLINPSKEEIESIVTVFQHLTHLKSVDDIQARLISHNWDIKAALEQFKDDLQRNYIANDMFTTNDELSDISTDDEMD